MGVSEVRDLTQGMGASIGTQYRYMAAFSFAIDKENSIVQSGSSGSSASENFKALVKNAGNQLLADPLLSTLWDPTFHAVLSSRVRRITPPKFDGRVTQKQIGILSYPIIQAQMNDTFNMVFLDTESYSISRFFSAWTQSILPKNGTIRDISVRCLSLTITMFTGYNIPVKVDIYPRVIPVGIVPFDLDKEGGEALISVNFMRVPAFYINPESVNSSTE